MRGGRIVLGILLVVAACSGDDDEPTGDVHQSRDEQRGAEVAEPTVSGPVTGGTYDIPHNAMPPELAEQSGYVEEEYVLAGTATAYEPVDTLQADGLWEVAEAGTAPYRTRIVVRRPADSEDFNGTVLVEWLNVTRGSDLDSDFALAHEMLLREGWAWVGVSAQVAGIESGQGLLPSDLLALKQWDPARYAELSHPGDAYSYDIFSQAAQALRRPGDVDPLDGLDADVVLATGSSQSAFRMVTYVNAVHPIADIYDGFSIHKRGRGAAPFDTSFLFMTYPATVHTRTDLSDPVLQFVTESDLFGGLRFYDARQDDSDTVVTWEVAGTAHADRNLLQYDIDARRIWDAAAGFDAEIAAECPALNDGQQAPYFRGALQALRDWVVDGTPPPTAAPLEVDGETIARDEHGNARGGVRTPAVEVPNRTVTGEPASGSPVCVLTGQTTPLDFATLAALYPTHDVYVAAVSDAVQAAADAGFLDDHDAAAIVAEAEAAPIPQQPQ